MFFRILGSNKVFNDKNIHNLKVGNVPINDVNNALIGQTISFNFKGTTYCGDLISRRFNLESYITKGMRGIEYFSNGATINTQLFVRTHNRKYRDYYIIQNNSVLNLRSLKHFKLTCQKWNNSGQMYTYLIYED